MRAVIGSLLALGFTTVVTASPITLGTWSPASSTAFYSGVSWDGPTLGIGQLLSVIPNLEYLHGPSESSVAFGWQVDAPIEMRLIAEIADYAGQDRIGWHQNGGSQWGNLFAGSNVPGDTAFLAPPVSQVGFWLLSPDPPYLFSSLNPGQFALFRSVEATSTLYIIGVEDLWVGDPHVDRDYQDQVFAFRESNTVVTTTPEPASLVLLVTGLLLCAYRSRRQVIGFRGLR